MAGGIITIIIITITGGVTAPWAYSVLPRGLGITITTIIVINRL